MANPIIYTYGNGVFLNSLFESLSMFFDLTQNSAMLSIGRFAALIGVIYISTAPFKTRTQTGVGQVDWTWFLRFAMVWIVIVVPKTTVQIEDLTLKQTYQVSNAPWALSYLAYLNSLIGYGFTRIYEDNLGGGLSPVEAYSQNGVAFGSSYYSTLPSIGKFDSDSLASARPFVTDCLVPSVSSASNQVASGISRQQFYTTSNLVQLINSINANFLMNRYVYVESGAVTCFDLRTQLLANADKDQQNILKAVGIADIATITGMDKDYIGQATDASANSLKQAMMINLVRSAMIAEAVNDGNPALADTFSNTIAQQQQMSAWRQGSQIAATSLVWIHVVAEGLVYAVWPLLCFVFLLPFGWSVFGDYIRILFWIQIWPVFFAILNSIIAVYATNKSMALSMYYSGMSFSNFGAIADFNSGVVSAAGYLSSMVPVISWMFLSKCGDALAFGINQMSGNAASHAERAGTQEALGDMDINRVSVQNSDTAGHKTTGLTTETQIMSTGTSTTIGGLSTLDSRATANKLNTNIEWGKAVSSNLSNQISDVQSKAGSEATQWQQMANSTRLAANSVAGSHNQSSGSGGDDANTLNHAATLESKLSADAKAVAEAKLGLEFLGSGGGLKSSVGVQAQVYAGAVDKYNKDLKEYTDFKDQHQTTTSGMLQNTFQSSDGLTKQSGKTISEALSVAKTATTMQTQGDSIKTSGDNAFHQHLLAAGYSEQEIGDMQWQDPGKFNKLAQDFVPVFAKQLGDNTDYSVKNVDSDAANARINNLANNHANGGNIDTQTGRAQGMINESTADYDNKSGTIHQAMKTGVDKFTNDKVGTVGQQMIDVGDAGADVVKGTTEKLKNTTKKSLRDITKHSNQIGTGIDRNISEGVNSLKQYNDNAMAPIRERDAQELREYNKLNPKIDSNVPSIKENLSDKQ